MSTTKAISEYFFKFTAFVPITWLVILYLFLLSCVVDLGHYPQPSLNDPKSIGLSFLYYGSWIGFLVFFYGSILWLVNLIICLYYKSVSKKHLILFLVGVSIALIQIVFDPGRLLYWFLD